MRFFKLNNYFYWVLPVLVGACLPLMAISNGSLAKSFGSPFTATFAVFMMALAGITLVMLVSKTPVPNVYQVANTPWWSWIGGLIVVLNIVTFSVSPSKIGVGNMIILFIASQLISSLLVEHFGILNTQEHPINWQRMMGALLLISAVFLIKRF